MAEAFRFFDRNHTGKITKADIAYGFDKMRLTVSPVDVDEFWKQLDRLGHHTANFNDFVACHQEHTEIP